MSTKVKLGCDTCVNAEPFARAGWLWMVEQQLVHVNRERLLQETNTPQLQECTDTTHVNCVVRVIENEVLTRCPGCNVEKEAKPKRTPAQIKAERDRDLMPPDAERPRMWWQE